MTGPIRFKSTLKQTGTNTTGIVVPREIMDRLAAGARPALAVRVNHYSFRTTVGVMGGRSLLPFSAEHRKASKLEGGDAIEVELQLDQAPRTVDLPEDLEKALKADPDIHAVFLKLAPSRRKAAILNVLGAKAAATRARRISALVSALSGRSKA
jgi:hypothetical protein